MRIDKAMNAEPEFIEKLKCIMELAPPRTDDTKKFVIWNEKKANEFRRNSQTYDSSSEIPSETELDYSVESEDEGQLSEGNNVPFDSDSDTGSI